MASVDKQKSYLSKIQLGNILEMFQQTTGRVNIKKCPTCICKYSYRTAKTCVAAKLEKWQENKPCLITLWIITVTLKQIVCILAFNFLCPYRLTDNINSDKFDQGQNFICKSAKHLPVDVDSLLQCLLLDIFMMKKIQCIGQQNCQKYFPLGKSIK